MDQPNLLLSPTPPHRKNAVLTDNGRRGSWHTESYARLLNGLAHPGLIMPRLSVGV